MVHAYGKRVTTSLINERDGLFLTLYTRFLMTIAYGQRKKIRPLNENNHFNKEPTVYQDQPINYYCYTDGSWVDENRKGGIGWILYDSQNILKIQGSTSTEATNSVTEIEALALKEAIIHMNKLSYQNVMFCGDSVILYKQLERVTKEEHQKNLTEECFYPNSFGLYRETN
ncbi:hypothetical protein N665_0068s0002 [Sinapis alba]|nr:hypothetical protein N665_0068s0002 [Sinapis alba]